MATSDPQARAQDVKVPSVNEPNKKLLEKPEVLADIWTGTTFTFRLCCIPNTDQFYVKNDDILKRMNTKGTLLEEIQPKSGYIPHDLTVTREGDLVYADYNDRSINIQKNGKIECLVKLSQDWNPMHGRLLYLYKRLTGCHDVKREYKPLEMWNPPLPKQTSEEPPKKK